MTKEIEVTGWEVPWVDKQGMLHIERSGTSELVVSESIYGLTSKEQASRHGKLQLAGKPYVVLEETS